MTTVSVRLPARELTFDDVAELADRDPDHRYEMQEGNLLILPPADAEHAKIIMKIASWLIAHGFDNRVLPTPGVRVGNSGRRPDIVVTGSELFGRIGWIEPSDVLLAIEIVSPGSVELDRHTKPRECAAAGIPNFWRVEREGAATVHRFGLGTGADGSPVCVPRGTALLEDLLIGPVPNLITAG